MKYEFNKEQITKAKSIVKELREKLEIWQKELEDAKAAHKKSASKYYQSIKKRVEYAQNQVEHYEASIKEFERAIKDKSIDI